MEIIPYYYLMTVSLQRCSCFWYQEGLFCFKLYVSRISQIDQAGLTLKDTMYPSGVHSCTNGFKTFGT
jgi:hypothetical protein